MCAGQTEEHAHSCMHASKAQVPAIALLIARAAVAVVWGEPNGRGSSVRLRRGHGVRPASADQGFTLAFAGAACHVSAGHIAVHAPGPEQRSCAASVGRCSSSCCVRLCE